MRTVSRIVIFTVVLFFVVCFNVTAQTRGTPTTVRRHRIGVSTHFYIRQHYRTRRHDVFYKKQNYYERFSNGGNGFIYGYTDGDYAINIAQENDRSYAVIVISSPSDTIEFNESTVVYEYNLSFNTDNNLAVVWSGDWDY